MITHAALIEVAAIWLRRKHAVVITELGTTGETPDAIGWAGTRSTLVECKASRADFLADRAKYFRQMTGQGIGMNRYYLSVPGIIKIEDLPPQWGLLEFTGPKIRTMVTSGIFKDANFRHEIGILLSTVRRIGQTAPKGTSIRCYTIETKNRASLGVAKSCTWTYDEHTSSWDTQCDEKFQFAHEGIKENGAKFCQYCGGQIIQKP